MTDSVTETLFEDLTDTALACDMCGTETPICQQRVHSSQCAAGGHCSRMLCQGCTDEVLSRTRPAFESARARCVTVLCAYCMESFTDFDNFVNIWPLP